MALSGSNSVYMGNNNAFSLIQEWKGTQNISNNTTTITVTVKVKSNASWAVASGWTNRLFKISINGNVKSFYFNPNMSGNQTKTAGSHTYTVPHNNDGTKTTNIFTTADYSGIVWNGSKMGVYKAQNNNVSLNKIPRHSSISSAPNFTLPASNTVSVTRQSSSFTHDCSLWVANRKSPTLTNDDHWTWVKSNTKFATSTTFSLNTSERAKIMKALNNSSISDGKTAPMKVKLFTNGISGVSQQKALTVTSPAAGTSTPSDFTLYKENNKSVCNYTISSFNSHADFSYTAKMTFKDNSGAAKEIDLGTAKSSNSFAINSTNVAKLVEANKKGSEVKFQIKTKTLFAGQQVRSETVSAEKKCKFNLSDFAPVKKAGSIPIEVAEISEKILRVGLKTSDYFVFGLSEKKISFPSESFTTQYGATISSYRITVGDIDRTDSGSKLNNEIVIKIPTEKSTFSPSSTTLSIFAIDSRGATSLSYSKEFPSERYLPPYFTKIEGKRLESESDENLVDKCFYKAEAFSYSFLCDKSFENTVTIRSESTGEILENGEEFFTLNKESPDSRFFEVTDRLGFSSRKAGSITPSDPIMFMNSVTSHIGIGTVTGSKSKAFLNLKAKQSIDIAKIASGKLTKFQYAPSSSGSIVTSTDANIVDNPDLSGKKVSKGFAGIDLESSDIIDVGKIVFPSNLDSNKNDDRGIYFPCSGEGRKHELTKLHMDNSSLFINNRKIIRVADNIKNPGEVGRDGSLYIQAADDDDLNDNTAIKLYAGSGKARFYLGKDGDGERAWFQDGGPYKRKVGGGQPLKITAYGSLNCTPNTFTIEEENSNFSKMSDRQLKRESNSLLDLNLYSGYTEDVVEAYSRGISENFGVNEEENLLKKQNTFLAEELERIGFSDYIEYDKEGKPTYIRKDDLLVNLIPIVKNLNREVMDIKLKLEKIEKKENIDG